MWRVPKTYPGSPLIAMTLLGSDDGYVRGEEFVFCDPDGESLSTISESASELSLPEDHLRLVEGDGITASGRELGDLSLSEVGFDPGVLGCGVVLCNVGEETLRVCALLGEGRASIYEGARLPDGSLDFQHGLL